MILRDLKRKPICSISGTCIGRKLKPDSIHRLGITKAGNSHLRQLLIEAFGGICRGAVGHKSKDLRARQKGNTADMVYMSRN